MSAAALCGMDFPFLTPPVVYLRSLACAVECNIYILLSPTFLEGLLSTYLIFEPKLFFYQRTQRVLYFTMPGHRRLLSVFSVHVNIVLDTTPI